MYNTKENIKKGEFLQKTITLLITTIYECFCASDEMPRDLCKLSHLTFMTL